ncbi:MAG: hypothetical protein H6603_01130 [Flavobacteriales bacterium]|nr:hypothetical protein [Flavobacteriales bacterium]MCB9192676.1 hypothetical protein [Flavobacteriales bacterium]MCB9203552.1 hypothetical protein [Flavobacteriales bacterium]
MSPPVKVESFDHLKQLAYRENGDYVHFYTLLAGGLARSSKRISYRPDSSEFLIINEIDESDEEVVEGELASRTNLVEAVERGAMFCCD